jgi:Lipocalin-like domain
LHIHRTSDEVIHFGLAKYSTSGRNMMDQRNMLSLAVITALGQSLLPANAIAQQKSFKEQLIGTWTIVQCEVVQADGTKGPLLKGSNLAGQSIFTDNGHFSFQVEAEIPKFASNDNMKTTPEENKAVVEGSIAYYGTYTASDATKTIALHIERSNFPNLNGTDGKRIVTAISSDEMKWINPGRFGGGIINCNNKRAK